jgi:ribonuclease T2
MRFGGVIAAVVAALLAAATAGAAAAQTRHEAGRFDYFVLALSWSPAYCAAEGDPERDALQCDGRRPFAFVAHGLWPQYERGFPEFCPSRLRGVEDDILSSTLDITPSRGLIRHQWTKHGVCSGFSQAQYFDLTRQYMNKIAVPLQYRALSSPLRVNGAQVEQAFLSANPALRANGVAVVCRGGRLREVRFCFTRDGRPRPCGSDVRDTCSGTVTMPPVRPAR